MLNYKSPGIKKLIFERIRQIDEEIVEADPEYQKLKERPDELLELIADVFFDFSPIIKAS